MCCRCEPLAVDSRVTAQDIITDYDHNFYLKYLEQLDKV